MRRAIALAMQGRGHVEPNPMVGCVIVRDWRIIGEGFHQRFGGPHAEPNALAACIESPAGATAYVTLEPCCHTNKKTPPCVPALINAKLARVVVGTLDPNPSVSGNGVAQLRAAGIRVDVLDFPPARQLIAPFVARTTFGRPYVTLKWAQTADGKVAGPGGRRLKISGDHSMRLVHRLRSVSDVILVGINTVLADDPMLTARLVEPLRPITRIILDRHLRIPLESRLVQTATETRTIIFTAAQSLDSDRAAQLISAGVEMRAIAEAPGGLSLAAAVAEVGRLGATHLLVEPGPTLAQSFIRDNSKLWDRAWIFRSPDRVEDPTAPAASPPPIGAIATQTIAPDELTEYLNPASDVFFAPDPSPEFVSAREDAR